MLDSFIDFVGIMVCVCASVIVIAGLFILTSYQLATAWDAWHRAIGRLKKAEVIYRYHTEDGKTYYLFPSQKKIVEVEE